MNAPLLGHRIFGGSLRVNPRRIEQWGWTVGLFYQQSNFCAAQDDPFSALLNEAMYDLYESGFRSRVDRPEHKFLVYHPMHNGPVTFARN